MFQSTHCKDGNDVSANPDENCVSANHDENYGSVNSDENYVRANLYENGFRARFPDYGPCEIKDWKEFLQKSRARFHDCFSMNKPFTQQETLADFDQVALLGSGSYSHVILIKHKDSKQQYAMKIIEKEKIIKSHKQFGRIKNEKMILQCMDFPLIVYLIYLFKDNSYIYMVLPFISGGDLYFHLKKNKIFDEVQTRFFASQVILALEYLHYLDFIYRDLKPENILIDHTGYLKITDFGFCKYLTHNRTYSLCGTPEYLAPEIILGRGYGKAIDWWSIGVLMYELVAGVPPFYDRSEIKIYEKILSNKYKIPAHFSNELNGLVKNILQVDACRRYGNLRKGVYDIKDHEWFKPINWMAVLERKVIAPYIPKIISPEFFANSNWVPQRISEENKLTEEFFDF